MSYCSLPLVDDVANATQDAHFLAIEKIVEKTQFCAFLITITVHFTIIWAISDAIWRNFEELKSPFFKLCLATAGVDVWTLLTNYFGAMFPKWGWFRDFYLFLDGFYAHTYLYFAWSTGICQAMGVSILAANRLSVMLFPTKFHLMWQGYRIWLAIGVQYGSGLLVGISTFFNNTQLFRNRNNGIVPKFLNETMTNIFFIIGGAFLFLNCLFLVLTYLFLFAVLHRRNQHKQQPVKYRSKRKEKARVREMKLFAMSTVTVCVQLSVLLLFVFGGSDLLGLTTAQFYMAYNVLSSIHNVLHNFSVGS